MSAGAGQHLYGVEQAFRIHGLGDMHMKAGLNGGFAVGVGGVRGNGRGRHVTAPIIIELPYLFY